MASVCCRIFGIENESIYCPHNARSIWIRGICNARSFHAFHVHCKYKKNTPTSVQSGRLYRIENVSRTLLSWILCCACCICCSTASGEFWAFFTYTYRMAILICSSLYLRMRKLHAHTINDRRLCVAQQLFVCGMRSTRFIALRLCASILVVLALILVSVSVCQQELTKYNRLKQFSCWC